MNRLYAFFAPTESPKTGGNCMRSSLHHRQLFAVEQVPAASCCGGAVPVDPLMGRGRGFRPRVATILWVTEELAGGGLKQKAGGHAAR